jgi:hypothetical protein
MSFSYSPKIVTDGLVLCYDPANTKSFVSGSTNIYDLSKNNYDGQLINGPVYSGVNYGVISLDATNDRVNIPDIGAITDGTVSVWFKNNNEVLITGSSPAIIFEFTSATTLVTTSFTAALGNVTAGDDELLSVYLSSDGVGRVGRYDATALNLTGSSLPSGWYNIVVSRDSSGTRVYFNNVLLGVPAGINITTITTSTVPFTRSFFNSNKIGRILNGLLSHVMIYNKGLTTAEVNRNYNALKSRFGL